MEFKRLYLLLILLCSISTYGDGREVSTFEYYTTPQLPSKRVVLSDLDEARAHDVCFLEASGISDGIGLINVEYGRGKSHTLFKGNCVTVESKNLKLLFRNSGRITGERAVFKGNYAVNYCKCHDDISKSQAVGTEVGQANTESAKAIKPLDVVNQRMQAHNAHDIEAFLATYSPDIQVYDYPNTPLGNKGHGHLRSIFEPLFKEQAVTVEIHSQLEHGKYIINQETVTRRGKQFRYLSIYEVQDGLIHSVRFLREY